MAASAANGVARRTKTRVHETDSEPAPGNTPDASPPLAGWNVRRRQSVSTPGSASAPLKKLQRHPLPPGERDGERGVRPCTKARLRCVSFGPAAEIESSEHPPPGRRT